ncbi:zinc carboxypeptidase domain-containing protein [Rhizoctonia solani AG-1 IA]|uniref:Zinc carboxypeptidase domain-containing protein n=1 Tax=Thanatephorus cucumeris (strain AG1-IA) TaxID=983506 RepID=L8WI10_THACA|nr:zinc carboxypeptidase domain-containing protein [Rhizoctonia solani AG-1 IA]
MERFTPVNGFPLWYETGRSLGFISDPMQVTEQIAYSLLSNYTTSPTIKSYVDKYDFYIFPVVNPDGKLRIR